MTVSVGSFAGIIACNASYLNNNDDNDALQNKKSTFITNYYESKSLTGIEIIKYIEDYCRDVDNRKYYYSAINSYITFKLTREFRTDNIFDIISHQKVNEKNIDKNYSNLSWSFWNKKYIIPEFTSFVIYKENIQKIEIESPLRDSKPKTSYIITLIHTINHFRVNTNKTWDYYFILSEYDKNIEKLTGYVKITQYRHFK